MSARRVVVALATGDRSARLVREAARVAARLSAELEGCFLEDEDLLRLAAHSFAHWMGSAGEARALRADDLEREWRAVAGEMRASLEREAASHRVVARFEVRRGRPRDALSHRVERGDIVVVGWGGWAPSARRAAPVRVLYDGSEAADRALEAGLRLAGEEGRLAVWIAGAGEGALDAMRARLAGRAAHVAPMAEPSVAAVRHALDERPGGLLLVPAGSVIADALAAGAEEARFPASVLVVH
ncbi:MAG: hypothetical protein KF729_35200 [Sandaracinaceae bacterium]|nr:hypothetical protein [Sandaracinaceae bacterium]